LPIVLLTLVAAIGTVPLLAVLAALAGLVIGVAEFARAAPRIPDEYRKLRPTKTWDGLWAFITVPKLHWFVRLGLFSATVSLLAAILRIAEVSQRSPDFAWGLLLATGALAGIESLIRHRKCDFGIEALGVIFECVFAAVVFFPASHSAWFKGAAAACLLEIAGFVIFCALAAARVDITSTTTAVISSSGIEHSCGPDGATRTACVFRRQRTKDPELDGAERISPEPGHVGD